MDRVLKAIDLKGQIKMDRVQITALVHKGIDHRDQIKMDRVRRGLIQIVLDHKDLVLIMDLDQKGLVLKIETTHKKKTSKFRGLFF
jgi:hypothetical protein